MNDILFKNAEPKVIAVTKQLEKWINDSSIFQGKVYYVGGCVRDLILGKPVKDIDIVVERENGGLMLANYLAVKDKSWNISKNPVVFETYGTAKVQLKSNPEFEGIELECVQTRKEQYHKESRNPDTVYGTIKEDASRRDLTINSLYYNISTGELKDFNGTGIYDLANKIIRTPCDPDITFSDDPLRILRVIRFSARLGWDISKETWLGMVKNAYRIDIVSQERITDEVSKILCTDRPSMGIRKMLYCGILHRVLPDIYDMQYTYESKNPAVTTFDHTMSVLEEIVDPRIEHRLAALFHDVGKAMAESDKSVSPNQFSADIAMADIRKMKYSNEVANTVACAIRHHEWFSTYTDGFMPPDKKIRKLMNSCGSSKNISATLDLMNANNQCRTYNKKKMQVLDVMKRIEELGEVEELADVKLPVDGNDIIKELGMKKGPVIGIILNELKEEYFENPDITREECLNRAKEIVMSLAV